MGDTIDCYRDQKANNYIIGVASQPDPFVADLVDEYYKVPVSTDPGYIDLLLKICRDREVDILIPTIDDEIYPLYLRKQEFEAINTKVSADAAGKYGSDKILFMKTLDNLGIPHPNFATFTTAEECAEAIQALGYPEKDVVVKLPNKAGSRGVRILSTNAYDFDSFANQKPTSKVISASQFIGIMSNKPDDVVVMAQDRIHGDEYSVDLLADHGKVALIVGRRNTVIENSIPFESVLEPNDEAFAICEKIVRELELNGNIGFDFILNREDDDYPIPIEMNARITATISLCAWGGCNLAYARVMQLLGKGSAENHFGIVGDVQYGKSIIRRSVPHFMYDNGVLGKMGGNPAWRL